MIVVNLVLEKIGQLRLVPVVVIEKTESAAPLAAALITGGLPCVEVTFRSEAALKSMKAFVENKDMLVGAGTILKVDQAKKALNAGAQFIVSPGFNPKVVEYCLKNDISVCPGVSNPTDIEMALDFGLELVKFFPAEAFGGVKTLKAISGPYNMIKFIPTGGINAANLADYLHVPQVWACGGSWMVQADLINQGNFKEIEKLTAEAVAIVKNMNLLY